MQTEGAHQKLADSECASLSKASLKCLAENNYDKAPCESAFEAYKQCKQRELDTRRQRRIEERNKRGSFFF